MKERPILFSAPMVRAILAGTKTQTRRVAPISDFEIRAIGDSMVSWRVAFSKEIKGAVASYSGGKFTPEQARAIVASQFNPYGPPGDRLWVREAWGWSRIASMGPSPIYKQFLEYRASGHKGGAGCFPNLKPPLEISAPQWRSAMFMPRWASRITLEITSVRVQRVQEIGAEDCIAEGLSSTMREHDAACDLRDQYRTLFDSINAKRAPWASNPWVWVIEFKRLTP